MAAPKPRPQKPETIRGYMAHQVLESMAHGYPIVLHKGVGVLARGRVVQCTNDHVMTASAEDGGSSLAVHFEDGSTIPLEQATAVKRAGD